MGAHSRRSGYKREALNADDDDLRMTMIREISAGGVVLHQISGIWHVALIEPQRENSQAAKLVRKQRTAILTLPKGLVDAEEKPEAAAVREVFEETGITAEVTRKLADTKYVYVRSWGDGARVFKIVSFYLMRYGGGEINDLKPEMRIEVKRALWVPLADATRQMAYSSECKMVAQAQECVEAGVILGGKDASTSDLTTASKTIAKKRT
jgi:8-oxo-dGTP pyrophosphatase MutT (NUDIX family)